MEIQTTRTRETFGLTIVSEPSIICSKVQIYWRELLRCRGLGIILTIISSFCIITCAMCVNLLPCMNPLQMVLYMSLFQTAVFAAIIIQSRGPILGDIRELKYLILHIVSGVIATNSGYYAAQKIPLLDSTTIVFSSPVVVIILERFFLKQQIKPLIILAVVITLAGVCLISKPFTNFGNYDESETFTEYMAGYIFAFVACFTLAVYFVSVQKIKCTRSSVVSIGLTFVTVLVNSVILTVTNNWFIHKCGKDGWYIVMSSVLATLGQFLLISALKIEKAGPVSIARTFDIVIAFIYQSFLLKEEVQWTSVLGSVLVSTSVILISWKKWKTEN